MSEVTIHQMTHLNGQPYNMVTIKADGGSRRERGSAIGAIARKNGWKRVSKPTYSETYGFQTRTTIRYEV